jgi:broad specificity phosphatase PhoE
MEERYPLVRLCFIRHAQARGGDFYDDDSALTLLGEQQAKLVGQRLANHGIDVVYTSPVLRSLKTAEPLCRTCGFTPKIDDRLREFEFSETPWMAALHRPDLVMWNAEHRGRPHGETLEEFSRRVVVFLEQIVELHLGTTVAVFTHSGVIDAAMRWFVGLPADAPWLHDLPLSNASITEVDFWPRGRVDGGAPRYTAVLRVADTGHLIDCSSDM